MLNLILQYIDKRRTQIRLLLMQAATLAEHMKYFKRLKEDNTFERTPSLFRLRSRVPERLRQLGAAFVCVTALTGASVSFAGTPFFIGSETNADPAPVPALGDAVQIFTTSASTLVVGMEIDLTLPSGDAISGSVTRKLDTLQESNASTDLSGNELVVVSFDEGAGALSVYARDDQIVGFEIFDAATTSYFSAALDSSGSGVFTREDPGVMHCVAMPIDFSEPTQPTEAELADVPDLDGLFNLESRPGATNVIYIDNDGGVTSGTAWNDSFNGGADIIYEPFSGDSDTSSYSALDQYLMYVGWLEMAEDYAPFDVNITTKLSVYEATQREFRSRLNATPTRDWVGFVGGIAYVGVFGRSDDYFTTGWTFNASAGSLGQTHSHEAGHQMGLRHDGALVPATEYYRGHGRWGPIMGAPFGQEYVQWSKGDYNSANRTENDLVKISGKLTTLADDFGDTEADAQLLDPPVFGVLGQITPDGLFSDVDVFTFTLNEDNDEAIVEVSTILGAEAESFAANAALNATLFDSFGTVVASMTSSDITPISPFTNKLEFVGPLDAGTYFLEIDAVSPDPDPSTGFNEYANGGQYLVTVDAEVGSVDPVIETPVPGSEIASISEVFTWSYDALNDTDFWLYLGSNPGTKDILDTGNLGPAGSYDTADSGNDLPLDGRDIYARLWYRDSDAPTDNTVPWEYIDAFYTTEDIGGAIVITSPSSEEDLPGPMVTFEYQDQNGSTDSWWLYAGSAVGQQDYFNSGLVEPLTQDNPSAIVLGGNDVDGLPVDGSTVFIRLWHREQGEPSWDFTDFTFTASSTSFVSFETPEPESVLPGPVVGFEFNDESNSVAEWWLYLGSAPGKADYYNSLNLGDVAETEALELPTNGETIYARLWYRLPNQAKWQFIDELFQAALLEDPS